MILHLIVHLILQLIVYDTALDSTLDCKANIVFDGAPDIELDSDSTPDSTEVYHYGDDVTVSSTGERTTIQYPSQY